MKLRVQPERVLCLRVTGGGREVGFVSGSFGRRDAGVFRLGDFSFEAEGRNSEVMRRAIRALLAEAPGISHLIWEYSMPEEKMYRAKAQDPRFRLMKSALLSLPEWEVSWRPYGFRYRVDMGALPETIRSESHYTEEQMAKDGMAFLPIGAMDDHEEEIRKLMAEDDDAEIFSPFRAFDLDPELSFLSLWHGKVVGWMLLCREDSDTVHIRRFYAAKEYRARAGGARTAAHMMRRVAGKCRFLTFIILPEQASNARFYARFFGPAMQKEEAFCRTEARRTEKE